MRLPQRVPQGDVAQAGNRVHDDDVDVAGGEVFAVEFEGPAPLDAAVAEAAVPAGAFAEDECVVDFVRVGDVVLDVEEGDGFANDDHDVENGFGGDARDGGAADVLDAVEGDFEEFEVGGEVFDDGFELFCWRTKLAVGLDFRRNVEGTLRA